MSYIVRPDDRTVRERIVSMKKTYTLQVAGLTRELPVCRISDDTCIAGFVMFGDVELTEKCAKELLKKAPGFDVLVTAESKGIMLLYEMAKQSGHNYYVVMRKEKKLYMGDVISVEVDSITTDHRQTLCIGEDDVAAMKGKRVLLVDDVISTGETLTAMEALIEKAGGNVVGRMAVLAEGDAIGREDIITLEDLPLLDGEGDPK